jgi:hypothetical protein
MFLLLWLALAADAGPDAAPTTTIDFEEDEAPVEIIRGEEERPGFDAGIPDKYHVHGGRPGPEPFTPSRGRGCAGCEVGALAVVAAVIGARRRR